MAGAFTSPDSSIPQNLLQLSHSFGYDCRRRGNLHLLDNTTLAFIAGNILVLLDMNTKQQRYIPSCSGGCIGAIMPHPSREYFAMAEKGKQPDIIIYEYPSLQLHRNLRGGTAKAYSCVNFNHDGTLLASVGGAPDYMLTLWDWNQEQVVLRCKAFSQDIYRVTFSPDNPGQLTTSGSGHIKFWKMADTFTCLKLQGMLGRFGKTPLTDIEGYVELPDGKVVSGSDWGNMLLWDGGLIKVEIRRKGGRTCHTGPIRQFVLDEGELITVGADGAIRCWDFEAIDTADCVDDSGLFEMQPMNELILGRKVSLSSIVRSTTPDSTLWFAQDYNGGIWKLDLSFSNITTEPECLFSFHTGAIEGLDVSGFTHLMATTALDRSIRIYDFLSNKELTVSHNRQGGSTLTWAPRSVCGGESLLVVGFEDGVVRLFELCNPQSLDAFVGRSLAALFLRQAFKPHNAPVKTISYMHNGNIMATGALDGTVFFFSVEESYEPIGFVTVPGPVQCMQWAPQSDKRNALLVVCDAGHVVEVDAPDTHDRATGNTYHLPNLPIKHFCFHSIKSRIKRDEEIAHRQAIKEKKKKEEAKEQETTPKQDMVEEEEESDEEEEELPPIFIPSPPSPLHCAFYSTEPGAFWLSVGGYDSGYLYHCKFSEQQQSTDPTERSDEPFAYIPIQDADDNPIVTVCFCEAKQLLLCGMQDGSIRAYPLESGELQPEQMHAYWAIGVHNDQYGSHRQLRVSHDNQFVLSTGADGNIFSFRLLEKEEMDEALQRGHAKVPSPPLSLDTESTPFDIDDPKAYSIETAKQKLELDRMIQEAASRKQERRKKLAELQKRFEALLQHNQSLPAHVRLQPSELELDRCFRDEIERLIAEKLKEVNRELAWEMERCRIGLQKMQERFSDSVVCDTVTVSGIRSDRKVSTYRLLALPNKLIQPKEQEGFEQLSDPASQEQSGLKEQKDTQADSAAGEALPDTTALQHQAPQGAGGKLAARQAEKLRKAAEKAVKARAKIEQRKSEWDEFYASKPSEDYEDPEDIRAISLAREHMGDFKLKMAKDFVVPEHLRMNTEKKTAQVVELEEQIYQRKNQMNERVLALRDSKIALVTQFCFHIRRLLAVQKLLPPEKHRSPPPIPILTPEETPERQLQCSRTTLERYAAARAKTSCTSLDDKHEEHQSVLGMMQQDGDEDTLTQDEHTHSEEVYTPSRENLSELEQEILDVEEVCNLYLQDKLIKQMDEGVYAFDAKLLLLRHEKSKLDVEIKLTDLRHITLLQELLLFKEFEKREIMLQERRSTYRQEERELRSKLKEYKYQLETKKKDIAKLQEREKHLTSRFQASLGDNNKFATFLTKVFKKKIKRVKIKEKTDSEDQNEESEDESDEESDWDSDEDEEELEGGFDDNVCPPNCDLELFNSALSLREDRLDLEELLSEEKMIADNLKKEYDSLTKKEKVLQSNLKAAEADLELLNREKQQKVNELDVVVPLRLHQIEYKNVEVIPSDLSGALVMNATSVNRLHERIKELHQEKSAQRQLKKQTHQQHIQLRSDLRDMEAASEELKAHCELMMVKRFGKLVDLEALQTLGGSQKLEERKYDREVKEAQNRLELNMWQVKVAAAKQELTDVTKEHTTRLRSINNLLTERKVLEDKLDARQKKTSNQFQEADLEDIGRLQLRVQSQAEKIEWLKQEISILSHKGGHVLPPSAPCFPPIHGNTSLQHRRAFP